MTQVTIIKHNGTYKGFVISGHSGYGKEGTDIICAAASVLGVSTANSLEKLVHVKLREEQADGYLSCQFEEELNEQGILLVDSMILGMQEISKNYGKTYIQVKFEEV